MGSSVFLYRYGKVFDNIIKDFPDIEYFKTSFAVDGDDLAKMPKTVGLGAIEITTVLEVLKPDAVITIADRFETMATAIAASYLNIPLIHIQGGEVSGTIDNKVRNAITQLSDYHFPATSEALSNIVGMRGIWNVFNYGCPSMDLLVDDEVVREYRIIRKYGKLSYHESMNKVGLEANVLNAKLNCIGTGDEINFAERYMIVMLHPDTVNPFSEKELSEFVRFVHTSPLQKVIFWNNIDPGGERIAKAWRIEDAKYSGSNTRFIRHIEPEDFGILLSLSSCIIGNSSAGIREATFMGTPSISVGWRQDGRATGSNVIRCSMSTGDLKDALTAQLLSDYTPSSLFGDGSSGLKIAQKIGEILNG